MSDIDVVHKGEKLKARRGHYQFELLTKNFEPKVISLFTRAFCDSEPITRHLHITYQDYEPFVREVVKKAIQDGMSVVALDESGNVIACAMAGDMTDLFRPQLAHYPKLKPVFSLLHELSNPFLKNKIFVKGKVAHVWIALVDEKHRGEGLSTEIDMRCGSLCVEKGYDFVYAEFTNPISEKIISHYKVLKKCNVIDYDDYTLDGSHPFEGVFGCASAYLVGIKPGVKMDAFRQCYKDLG